MSASRKAKNPIMMTTAGQTPSPTGRDTNERSGPISRQSPVHGLIHRQRSPATPASVTRPIQNTVHRPSGIRLDSGLRGPSKPIKIKRPRNAVEMRLAKVLSALASGVAKRCGAKIRFTTVAGRNTSARTVSATTATPAADHAPVGKSSTKPCSATCAAATPGAKATILTAIKMSRTFMA